MIKTKPKIIKNPLLRWQNPLQLCRHLRVERLREVDHELDDELALLEGVPVGGHPLAEDALDGAVLRHLARDRLDHLFKKIFTFLYQEISCLKKENVYICPKEHRS